jgi:hypothetical protein
LARERALEKEAMADKLREMEGKLIVGQKLVKDADKDRAALLQVSDIKSIL